MKFVDEYRGAAGVRTLLAAVEGTLTRPWTLMEICGGQTHTILKTGIDRLLPAPITLVHGPGCPVCVTAVEMIDRAIAIARDPRAVLVSFGDMLRVPGTRGDLLSAKADGGDVRMVYSPLDALRIARENPEREVVFFAVGFETTAPANAMAVDQARQFGLSNFSILCAHVRVPPAMDAILAAPDCRVDAFLAAGHVCAVMGTTEYDAIAARHRVPIVVTGFEPLDLLDGVLHAVRMLEDGQSGVVNRYRRVVRREGNPDARRRMEKVFEIVDRSWRGIGTIPSSGLALRPEYAAFDAASRFPLDAVRAEEDPACIAGAVLRGLAKPTECGAFGSRCTPEHPLGAPMVSSEGACAAYHRYGRAP